jgi:hypothetical protein
MSEPIKWPNQFAHMLFSIAVLFGQVIFFPHHPKVTLILVLSLVAYAAVKEFWWDVHVEKSQDDEGAGIDAVFYSVAAVTAYIALLTTGKL